MKRKWLCLLLALVMALSLMPVIAMAAPEYVTVGTATLNADHPYYVDGAASATGTLGEGGCTAQFDAAAGTLTLKNAEITKNIPGYGGGISAGADLTLALEGASRIAVTGSGEGARGVYISAGNLTIQGDGELTINSHSDGIYVLNGDLTIESGRINATAAGMNNGLCALGDGGNVGITGGRVTASGKGAGIYGEKSIAISGSAVVTGQGETYYGLQGGQFTDNFSISGSAVVTAIGAGSSAKGLKAVTSNDTHVILAGADAGSAAKQPGRLLASGNTYQYVHLEPGQLDSGYVMEVDMDGEGGNAPVSYESFVEGWQAAMGSGNTSKTTVKLLANWTADSEGYLGPHTTDGAGFAVGESILSEYTGSLHVRTGYSVTLDLNGHTIDRNLSEEKDNGYVIIVDGTLTLKDTVGGGKLTGGYDYEVGGVSVYGGTFTMESGEISGNHGAGVYVLYSGLGYGKFTMKGGKIQNNDKYGVYFQSGTVTLAGAPEISGNTADGRDAGNLYLSGRAAAIGTGGLSSGANIGVTYSSLPAEGEYKTIATNSNGANAAYFHSDKTGYELYDDSANSAVELRKTVVVPNFTMTFNGVTTGYDTLTMAWNAAQSAAATEDNRAVVKMNQDHKCSSTQYFKIQSGDHITLDLNGHTVDRNRTTANSSGRAFLVEGGGSFILEDTSSDILAEQGKVTRGYISDDGGGGGAVYVEKNGSFTLNGGNLCGNKGNQRGGAVYNEGAFTMNGGGITGNTTTGNGGGVSNFGTFVMNGGEIADNAAADGAGGGVHNYGNAFSLSGPGSFAMNGGKIANNTARWGGGIQNSGELVVNGQVLENSASYGGGIHSEDQGVVPSTVLIKAATKIEDNKALTGDGYGSGGGVYFQDGTLTIEGGSIARNSSIWGGGVYAQSTEDYLTAGKTASVSISGGKISNNSAGYYGGGLDIWDANLNMTGGEISENNGSWGGGVHLGGGDFKLHGGQIVKNSASTVWGGGVYFSDGAVSLQNDMVIAQNTYNGAANNLFFGENTTAQIGAMGSNAKIGVTTEIDPTAEAPVTLSANADVTEDSLSQFSSDDETNCLQLREGTLKLHLHVLDQTVAAEAYLKTPADCTHNAVYYKSCGCGAMGTNTFEAANTAIEHSWSDDYLAENADEDKHHHICTECGAKDEGAAHFPKVINAKDATETQTGYTGDVVCSICWRELEKGEQVPMLAHIHSGILIWGYAPTCTADGTRDYYACTCGKSFEDAACTRQIANLEAWRVIKAVGHQDENRDDRCDACGAYIDATSDIPKTGETGNAAVWLAFLLASGAAMAGALLWKNRKKEQR